MIVDVLIVPANGDPYVGKKDLELPTTPTPEPESEPATGDMDARMKILENELSALRDAIAKGAAL